MKVHCPDCNQSYVIHPKGMTDAEWRSKFSPGTPPSELPPLVCYNCRKMEGKREH